MSARDEVLRRVRDALGSDPHSPEVRRAYRVTGEGAQDALPARFAERVAEYRAAVHHGASDEIPALIAALLADRGHRTVAVPEGLPEAWTVTLEVHRDHGELSPLDLDRLDAVVTTCAVAIAETGTIVLDGGSGQGRRALTLIPDHHLCVVPAERIVAGVPEALARLDPRRPITLISGPSATSDIELDRVEGVHGPRCLDVVLVSPERAHGS